MAAALHTAEQLLTALQALGVESSHVGRSAAGSCAPQEKELEGTPPATLATAPVADAQELQRPAPGSQPGVPDEAQQRAVRAFLSRRLAPASNPISSVGGRPSAGGGSIATGVQPCSGGAEEGDNPMVELLTGPTLGVLLACAYPERVAQRQTRGNRQGFTISSCLC